MWNEVLQHSFSHFWGCVKISHPAFSSESETSPWTGLNISIQWELFGIQTFLKKFKMEIIPNFLFLMQQQLKNLTLKFQHHLENAMQLHCQFCSKKITHIKFHIQHFTNQIMLNILQTNKTKCKKKSVKNKFNKTNCTNNIAWNKFAKNCAKQLQKIRFWHFCI